MIIFLLIYFDNLFDYYTLAIAKKYVLIHKTNKYTLTIMNNIINLYPSLLSIVLSIVILLSFILLLLPPIFIYVLR
jgi:hypothetical protein